MRVSVALVLLLLATAPIHALDITCEPSSSPLLKIIEYDELPIPPPPGQFRTLLLVCKDRRWLRGEIIEAAGYRRQASLLTAVATEQGFKALTARMAVARIGAMRDCSFNGEAPFALQVTWLGRPGRTNSFNVYSVVPNEAEPCTAEELDLVLNIHFESTQFEMVRFP